MAANRIPAVRAFMLCRNPILNLNVPALRALRNRSRSVILGLTAQARNRAAPLALNTSPAYLPARLRPQQIRLFYSCIFEYTFCVQFSMRCAYSAKELWMWSHIQGRCPWLGSLGTGLHDFDATVPEPGLPHPNTIVQRTPLIHIGRTTTCHGK